MKCGNDEAENEEYPAIHSITGNSVRNHCEDAAQIYSQEEEAEPAFYWRYGLILLDDPFSFGQVVAICQQADHDHEANTHHDTWNNTREEQCRDAFAHHIGIDNHDA